MNPLQQQEDFINAVPLPELDGIAQSKQGRIVYLDFDVIVQFQLLQYISEQFIVKAIDSIFPQGVAVVFNAGHRPHFPFYRYFFVGHQLGNP
jgi:hypothetical protein